MPVRALDVLSGTSAQLLAVACDSGTLDEDVEELAGELGPTSVVRVLRGRKMRSAADLFDECAAALQFPYYFGENWDSFDECMRVVCLPAASAYVFVLHDALAVLAGAGADQLDILIDLLIGAASDASEPRTVRVLLHCYPGEEDALARRYLTRSNGAPSPVELIWISDDDDD
jgi:hypothetical protein